ncbi:MAG: hypothetical protein Q9162_002892 [Coniocarpon cinnabarinum]
MRSLIALLPAVAASPLVLLGGAASEQPAPIVSAADAQPIKDSYMVVFKDHVSHEGAAAHHSWVQELHYSSESSRAELRKRSQLPLLDSLYEGLKHIYDIPGSFLGYSGHFDEDTIQEIRRHPDVKYIEQDQEVHTLEYDEPYRDADVLHKSQDGELQRNSPWGLARISHRDGLSFGNFNKYLYAEDGGEGVDVYVIDTGTNIHHVDFGDRAKWERTVPQNDPDEDGNGHGTHCSGTIAGKKYGVAKKANIRAIKVLRSNGSGTMSDVVKGVEHAAEAHLKSMKDAKDGKRKGFKGSAANMSLGGGKSPTLDATVNAAVDAGIHFAVAAGNDNANSCNYSPASAEKAVTVGATNLADERAYFSNYGKCNDIFAPGVNILSTWIGSEYAVNTISGTSMASPHIAGLLAYLLSLQPSKESSFAVEDLPPATLKSHLTSIATRGAISDVPSNTQNLMAWNGGGSNNLTDIVGKSSTSARAV